MSPTIQLQLLLATFAGWVCRQQTCVIDYLVEENRVLREQIEASGKRMRLTDDQHRPSRCHEGDTTSDRSNG